MATVVEVRERLRGAGYEIAKESRLPNETGDQLRLVSGQVVNVFDKGTVNVQGRDCGPIQEVLAGLTQRGRDPRPARETLQQPREVFVVYGHDEDAKRDLEAMLRRWNLEPLMLDQLPSEGQTIIEKLETYRARAEFAVVLATPDDEGYRAGKPDEKQFRARQNVVLELGMMLSILGRSKVAILLKGQADMERPSDIQGLIYIPFTDRVDEAKLQLAKEMDRQGFKIEVERL
jgi:predicted nucleotide-binding protein